ncbi:putative ribonuclease H protein [Trifolium medium]|uniref:Putative ribonuclease H protein n=1 Tax=Trifolium medium TaxID=97028 RepID=A0A392P013_9FABA|nr:putative ribonuclease H protein [Trifolium medium]
MVMMRMVENIMRLVGTWESVTKPKAYGGLGLRRLVHMNTACLMKLGWAIRSGEEALWTDVIKGKYGRGNSNFEHVEAKTHDSSLLKSLVKLWRDFDAYEFWSVVSNGNSVNAWKDRWLFQGDADVDNSLVRNQQWQLYNSFSVQFIMQIQ